MCGRFTVKTPAIKVGELFDLSGIDDFEPRYNVAPTQSVPVIRREEGTTKREFVWMRWGLIPRWAKDLSIGAKAINARAETIAEKPMFRDAYAKRRCLVIADGYYEWKASGKKKQPYYLHFPDARPFAFAGLWERWTGPTESVTSFTIITTAATGKLAWLHERMPVIVPPEHYPLWLPGNGGVSDIPVGINDDLIAEPVSSLVNKVSNDTAECIRPIESNNLLD